MSLFQKSVLSNYLDSISDSEIDKGWSSLQSYKEMASKVQSFKEEEFQADFLTIIFADCFGYISNYKSGAEGNLFFEQKNKVGSKKADGTIIKDGEVIAVIELKSTKTKNLDDVKAQAFGYYTNNSKCEYVITSNFNKLRFYIERNEDYLEFDLFNIDKEEFKLLWLCLDSKNLLEGKPKEIKNKSLIREENITKKLYQDYSTFRQELFNDLAENNQTVEKRVILNKTQKLLDRLLFILFSEDRGLLPANSISEIINHWEFGGNSLYSTFLTYFEIIYKGRPKRGDRIEIYAYNGGLFSEDVVLNTLNISDDVLLRNVKKLTKYDFESDVSVDILGHIFEHSLTEIEELQGQIDAIEIDKSKSKRKKDGVYYTPKYITKYIVDNTLGKLCNEKKIELDINEETYSPSASRRRNRINALEEYRNWLLNLTICDPACGSGAFLIQALNFLIKEHHYIDELSASYNKYSLLLSDVKNSILENNLYGVDINQESVEIAKLSLWLNTAESKRKLVSLNNNIKCGNSLIDDIEVAGDRAFNWGKAFPDVFEKGGFDVIIGNPPYVFSRDNISIKLKNYYSQSYVSAEYQVNTYLLFVEQTIKLIRNKANYGLIIPNAWLMVGSAKGLRKLILENCSVNEIVNLTGYSFDGINVETIIILASKIKPIDENNEIKILLSAGKEFRYSHKRKQVDFKNSEGFEFKVFSNEESLAITKKLIKDSKNLDDLVIIKAGLQAYEKNKGIPKQTIEDVKNRPYDYTFKFDENTHKYLEGKDVGRYNINWGGQYLQYGKQLAAPRTFDLFDGEKIILREITGNFPNCLISSYSSKLYLYNRSNIAIVQRQELNISLKYIVAILNSKLMSYFFLKNTAKSVRKMFPKIILNDLRKFPIKDVNLDKQEPFIKSAEVNLRLNKEMKLLSFKFKSLLESDLSLERTSKKLETWFNLDWGEFENEIRKQKIILKGEQKEDWFDRFNRLKLNAQTLKNQINQTDKEIDEMVYELYGLTKEEIEIVENS